MNGYKNSVTTLASDNILLERISNDDLLSFDVLFRQHYDRVYGLLFRLVGNRVEAEDLTQEVFIKLHHHAFKKRFFSKKENNISAWLYRTATNAGYNALRSRKRRWQRDTLLLPDREGAPDAEAEVERIEQETAVRHILSTLPKRQTQLLLMRQMGFSYAECAKECDVAPASIGTLLSRAMKAFKVAYEAEYPV